MKNLQNRKIKTFLYILLFTFSNTVATAQTSFDDDVNDVPLAPTYWIYLLLATAIAGMFILAKKHKKALNN